MNTIHVILLPVVIEILYVRIPFFFISIILKNQLSCRSRKDDISFAFNPS